jgi:hypothetical protein
MNMIPFNPAPSSVGILMPGQWAVPNNPIADAISLQSSDVVRYKARLGEIMAARFAVPENPLLRELSGCSSLRGCSSGCGGGCSCGGNCGMGDWSEDLKGWYDTAVTSAKSMFGGIDTTTLLLAGGAVVALYFVMGAGGSEYRGKMGELRRKQVEERRTLKRSYRGYRRAARAIAD